MENKAIPVYFLLSGRWGVFTGCVEFAMLSHDRMNRGFAKLAGSSETLDLGQLALNKQSHLLVG